MSYFGKSIIRGAGNEIGRSFARTAINKIAKGADANYVNVSGGNYGTSNRVKYNSTLNDQINKKLNTSFIEENKQKLNDAILKTDRILNSKWTNEKASYQWIIILLGLLVISPTVSGIISLISSQFLSDVTTGMISFLGFIVGLYFTPTIIGFKKKKKKRAQEYYDNRREELKEELKIMEGAVKYLTNKYGEEMTLNMVNRTPVKGMTLENFTFFFGQPNLIEETEDTLTLIYGTSKRAGDWFRFKNEKLVTYTVK